MMNHQRKRQLDKDRDRLAEEERRRRQRERELASVDQRQTLVEQALRLLQRRRGGI